MAGDRDHVAPELLRERLGLGADPSSEAAASQVRSQLKSGRSPGRSRAVTPPSGQRRPKCGQSFASTAGSPCVPSGRGTNQRLDMSASCPACPPACSTACHCRCWTRDPAAGHATFGATPHSTRRGDARQPSARGWRLVRTGVTEQQLVAMDLGNHVDVAYVRDLRHQPAVIAGRLTASGRRA